MLCPRLGIFPGWQGNHHSSRCPASLSKYGRHQKRTGRQGHFLEVELGHLLGHSSSHNQTFRHRSIQARVWFQSVGSTGGQRRSRNPHRNRQHTSACSQNRPARGCCPGLEFLVLPSSCWEVLWEHRWAGFHSEGRSNSPSLARRIRCTRAQSLHMSSEGTAGRPHSQHQCRSLPGNAASSDHHPGQESCQRRAGMCRSQRKLASCRGSARRPPRPPCKPWP
mmetsp:Transcript_29890/g.56043  ORF Transcript_29890/g.56043 Transcript_29890/m.56043 type:complete len:222 (+) Transcript_29890:1402-2067(+)